MHKNILNLVETARCAVHARRLSKMKMAQRAVATITLFAIFASIPASFGDPLSPAEVKSLLARIREKRAAEPQVEADFHEEKIIRLMTKIGRASCRERV